MKNLFILVVIALIFSLLNAGIKKSEYSQYGVVVFRPDSMVINRAHTMIIGNFVIVSSDTADTANIVDGRILTIDTVVVADYLYSIGDVQFDSTLTFGSGAILDNPHEDTFTITEANVKYEGKLLSGGNMWIQGDTTFFTDGSADTNYVVNNGTELIFGGDNPLEILQALTIDDGNLVVADGQHIVITDGTEADSFQIYDDGSRTIFTTDNAFTLDGNVWIPGDTLYFTDGGEDTSFVVNNGTYLVFGGDIHIQFVKDLITTASIIGYHDLMVFEWHGYRWALDRNDSDALAYIYFHGIEGEAIKVDSAGQKLWWTGAGGIGITDAVGGADSARWYDDGVHTKFASDNPFTMDNALWMLDNALFLTDGGEDTSFIVQEGSNLQIGSDNDVYIIPPLVLGGDITCDDDTKWISWDGWKWHIDHDGDDSLAYISYHDTDSLKSDTMSHIMAWTGYGGYAIEDTSGADTSRWYDDGTHTTFTTDNDFVLKDDVILGDTINTVFLPKGTRLILADTSGTDSFAIHHDGTNLVFSADTPIKFADGQNIWIFGGDTLFFIGTNPQDTVSLAMSTTAFNINSDLPVEITGNRLDLEGHLCGTEDSQIIDWDGHSWRIDSDKDDSLAVFIWHNTDTLKADTIYHQLEWTGVGGIKADNIVTNVCDTIASGVEGIVTLGNYNNFVITGTVDIDSIDTAGTMPNWGIAYIEFTGTAGESGLKDGKNLRLEGDFSCTPDDIIVLQRRGNIFYELSRSPN